MITLHHQWATNSVDLIASNVLHPILKLQWHFYYGHFEFIVSHMSLFEYYLFDILEALQKLEG